MYLQPLPVACLTFLLFLPTFTAQLKANHRPQFHFSVPKGWLNDPNGLLFYKGEYHIFYQFNPTAPTHGNIHWGHAVSTDLITWTDHGSVISPDPKLGQIYSGTAIVDYKNTAGFKPNPGSAAGNDVIVAMFTNPEGETQVQSLAYSTDKGQSFHMHKGNPVLSDPRFKDFRDPKIFRWKDLYWVAVLVAGKVVRFYKSQDLKSWVYMSEFGGVGERQGVWECPDLFPLKSDDGSNHWVLLVSVAFGAPNFGSATQYFVGTFSGTKFTSTQKNAQWMDYGPDNYASISFNGLRNGKVIVIGWMNNWVYATALPTRSQGFNGIVTLPRELTLKNIKGNHKLVSNPVQELKALKKTSLPRRKKEKVIPGKNLVINVPPAENKLLHVKAKFTTTSTGSLCFVNDIKQEVCITYEKGKKELVLTRVKSGNKNLLGKPKHIFYKPASAERLVSDEYVTLEIYLDYSSIEVFADGGLTVLTALLFPDKPFSTVEMRQEKVNGKPNSMQVAYLEVETLFSMDEFKKNLKKVPSKKTDPCTITDIGNGTKPPTNQSKTGWFKSLCGRRKT